MGLEDVWTTPEGRPSLPRRPRWGGGGNFGFSFTGLQPYLNALMGRWGDVMDIQTQRLRQQAAQDPAAFREWKAGKEQGRASEQQRMELEYAQWQASEEARAEAERQQREALQRAENERRAALNAAVDRARSQHGSVMSATPFSSAGALADFYEYGPHARGGRGGGGSVGERGSVSDRPQEVLCPPGTRNVGNQCVPTGFWG